MDVELRHLRCLVAIVEAGGFTGAAAELGVTQPAVSRTLAALEDVLGVRLLRRTSREVVLTAAGERVLAHSRRVLAEVEDLAREARSGGTRLRIGHAWAAVGEHTVEFQRRWAVQHPDVTLHVVRTNSPTGGLAEGACDVAVVRTPSDAHLPEPSRFDSAVVGLESRFCALATADHSPDAGSCAWPTSRTGSWPSIRAPAPPPPTSGHPTAAPGPRTPTTSTTGSPSSPPDAASA